MEYSYTFYRDGFGTAGGEGGIERGGGACLGFACPSKYWHEFVMKRNLAVL